MSDVADLTTQDGQKRAAGEAAARLVEDGMTLGLGTGSTAASFLRALARRVHAEGLDVRGVPTSRRTEVMARELGITVIDLDEADRIDLTVDGVDEIDPDFVAIKGAGGALLREKLVWSASRRCVAIADASKRVERLGAFALPIEVIRFGHAGIVRRLSDALQGTLAANPRFRLRAGAEGPFVTDEGHLIYDLLNYAELGPQGAVAVRQWRTSVGVVEHGLFDDQGGPWGLADEALIATPAGVQHLINAKAYPAPLKTRVQVYPRTELE